VNLRTFYSNNYFSISRDSLYFDTRPLDHIPVFYSFFFIFVPHSVYRIQFTPHILSLFTRVYFTCVEVPERLKVFSAENVYRLQDFKVLSSKYVTLLSLTNSY